MKNSKLLALKRRLIKPFVSYRDYSKPFARKYYKGSAIFNFGWFLWLSETIIFLIIYGWHWQPANSLEKVLDYTSFIIMIIGISRWVSCVNDIIKAVISENETH